MSKRTNDQMIQDLKDLEEAMKPSSVENMTGLELANLLGLPLGSDGLPDWVDFLNACLHIQTYEVVKQLPHDERIRVLRTASGVLSHMHG